MNENNRVAAANMVELIRELIQQELVKEDNTATCQIMACNSDGSYDITILPDEITLIKSVKSITPENLKQGDYAYVYKFKNKLSNAIIFTRIGGQGDDVRFITTDEYDKTGGYSGGGGGGSGTVKEVHVGTGLAISGDPTVEPTINISPDYKLPTSGEWSEALKNQRVKAKLNGVDVTFGADDVVEFVAGTNVTLTPDATNKTITIASSGIIEDKYQSPDFSSGLKISTAYGTGLGALYIPEASTSQEGVLKIGTGATDAAAGNHNHSGVYQPLDADLTAIAGLTGNSGLLKKTAANTWTLDTNSYVVANNAIPGATKCKITYDSKGLVTGGADLDPSDIPELGSTYLKRAGGSSNAMTGDLYLSNHNLMIDQGAIQFDVGTNGTAKISADNQNGDFKFLMRDYQGQAQSTVTLPNTGSNSETVAYESYVDDAIADAPFVPLAGNSGSPMTGDLYLGNNKIVFNSDNYQYIYGYTPSGGSDQDRILALSSHSGVYRLSGDEYNVFLDANYIGNPKTYRFPDDTYESGQTSLTLATREWVTSSMTVDTNQKIRTSSVTFGPDDVVEFVNGGNVTITGNSTAKTMTLGVASGYSIPSTTKQGEWDAKYDLPVGGIPSSDVAFNYAGSSSKGGAATSALKLSNTTKIGDTNQPVYFTNGGIPAAISYTIEKSVPSNAVFTDTATAADNILDGSNSGTQITYAPYAAATATSAWVGTNANAGKLYLGTVDPVKTTRLNYNGDFHATSLWGKSLNFNSGNRIEMNASDSDQMDFIGESKYLFYGDQGDAVLNTGSLSSSRVYNFPNDTYASGQTSLTLATREWVSDGYIPKTLTSAKGDIIYASAASTPARLAIGTEGQVLKVSSNGVPVWSSDSNNNQKVKTSSVTFGADDTIQFTEGSNITITGDATAKTITISGKAGTVTSVGLRNGSTSQGTLTISGSPITSSGTIDITLANNYGDTKNPYSSKAANKVLAGPASGSAAAPSFRSLEAADIPNIYVRFNTSTQGLDDSQKANARINIGAAASSHYHDTRYVRFDTNAQGLNDTQKTNARTNIGAGIPVEIVDLTALA